MNQPQPIIIPRGRRAGLPRRVRLTLALLIAALAGIQLAHFLDWTPEQLAGCELILGDAYFYSVLARNFARFGALTLDGEMVTNGVQPLWMSVQILLVQLFPSASEADLLARSPWVTYLLFCFAAIWGITGGTRRRALIATLLLSGTVLLNTRFQAYAVQGVETPLVLLLIILTWMHLEGTVARGAAGSRLPRAHLAGLGLLAALVFLTRTDLFWIPLLLGLWLWRRSRGRLRDAVIYGVSAAVPSVPYLLHNLVAHGHLIPISGRVKLFYCQLAHPTIAGYLQSQEWHAAIRAFASPFAGPGIPIGIAALIALALLALALLSLHGRLARTRAVPALRLLALALLLHLVFMHIFYRELRPANAYYFAPAFVGAMLCVAIAAGGLAESLPRPAGRRATVATLLLVLVGGGSGSLDQRLVHARAPAGALLGTARRPGARSRSASSGGCAGGRVLAGRLRAVLRGIGHAARWGHRIRGVLPPLRPHRAGDRLSAGT